MDARPDESRGLRGLSWGNSSNSSVWEVDDNNGLRAVKYGECERIFICLFREFVREHANVRA